MCLRSSKVSHPTKYSKIRCGQVGDRKQCLGVLPGGDCSQTADCNPGYYCERGKCTLSLGLGQPCTNDNSCGRRAVCLWNDTNTLTGVCTAMFTVDNNTQIANIKSKRFQRGPFANLVCKTGWADENGICTGGPKSKNRGNPCQTDRDCETDNPSIFAKCLCGMSETGTKFCDIMAGDEEWVSSRRAVPKTLWLAISIN
eukprot:TRINITY_DN1642_c0_g1_i7.p1 TRINITY_DN1642_c0_g1~~TRINITY_DN1642_c0_g1_i7.p1  ORF type:complete len:199 (+),score=7.24 TRINITY_DN1642_c0_g1_i7:148-744(+)